MKNKIFMIGNAHLDPVWFWRWQEGFQEVKATFKSALDRIKETDEFIFTCSSACYYKWVEENDEEMFEEIKKRVSEGKWIIVGGWWIQPDCNMPSGESFVRQGLYSQNYFKEKFGHYAKVAYNVDSFGHNGNLPQILKKSNMDYYVMMRPTDEENSSLPNLFKWQGNDKSEIMTFKIPFNEYSVKHDKIEERLNEINEVIDEKGADLMCFYGVGNHGGGPTKKTINKIKKLQETMKDDVEIIFSSPNEYFESVKNCNVPTIKTDLQHHASGCYSVVNEIKKNNRRSENRIVTSEKYATIANILFGLKYPKEKIFDAWENIMFNQFHDILDGCSIEEAYEDAREMHGEALSIGAKIMNSSLQKISWNIDTHVEGVEILGKEDGNLWEQGDHGTPVVIFNSLSFEVTAPIIINNKIASICDENKVFQPIQYIYGTKINKDDKYDTVFNATIPAMGYVTYWIYKNKKVDVKPVRKSIAKENIMENDFLYIKFENGYIKKMYDKKNKKEIINIESAVPVVLDDSNSDTWGHKVLEFRNEEGKFELIDYSIVESEGIRSRVLITYKYKNSILKQDFILYSDSEELLVECTLNFNEKQKIVKLAFNANLKNTKANYEIPYSHIEKDADGKEESGHNWVNVTADDESYGLSLLNDSKYSYDIKNSEIRLTIARSSMYADHFGNHGDFSKFYEYIDQGIQKFKYAIKPHKGSWKTAGVVKKAYELNNPPEKVIETYHKGELPRKDSYIKISNENIIATVLKKSEKSEDYILRCYEVNGKECKKVKIELKILDRVFTTDFGVCEIKTFKIPKEKSKDIIEVNLLEV